MTETSKHWQPLIGGVEQATTTHNKSQPTSQRLYLEHLQSIIPFKSMCDLGCGPGYWVNVACKMGIEDAMGYDIPIAGGQKRLIEASHLVECDLSELYDFGRRFDLAVSTEVIEHIPQGKEGTFIANCCAASDFVLFSGAIPYQGGVGHVNEHWLEHWNSFFKSNGYVCFDLFREKFWYDPRIQYYYRQNTVFYVHCSRVDELHSKGLNSTSQPQTRIHPEMIIQCVNRALPPSERHFLRDVGELYDAVSGKSAEPNCKRRHAYGAENMWFSAHKKAIK